MPSSQLVDRLMTERPNFHGKGTVSWSATRGTLDLIDRVVEPGNHTLETGAGASTVVFASRGARHTAVSPMAAEHAAIAAYAKTIDIDMSAVTMIAATSDSILPTLPLDDRFDVVFVDGAHSYPIPAVDWHYGQQRLTVGGLMILDDVPIPAVVGVFDLMHELDNWEFVEIVDSRAAVFRKTAEPEPGDFWRYQRANRAYPDFSFLPLGERLRATNESKNVIVRNFLEQRAPGLAKLAKRTKRRLKG